jgi:1L-myo-inositol 1-phosphate cytidylyltransferase / CDP-L-myo-inositol myo-inositolphosphotransferase
MNDYASTHQADSIILTAVLLLPAEPDWYWHNLAQVPFLLRNALTLQRAGIKKLIIWMQSPAESIDARQLEQDPRIDLNIEWIVDNTLLNTCAMVLDGSTLLEESEIVEAMTPSSENRTDTSSFYFFPDPLKQLLESQETNLIAVIPAHESSRLFNEKDFQAAEEQLLKSAGLGNDSLMDRLVTRFISRQLTRLFLKTGLTPNQITFLSLLIGLGSAWSFYQGSYFPGVVGSLLLLVSAWVDCTDGEIARLKFMETPQGAQLDIFCDNIVHLCVFFAIGIGLFFQTGDSLYKLSGGLAVYGSLVSFILLNSIIVKQKQAAGQGKPSDTCLVDQLANRDFAYFLLVMACVGRLDIFIILAAIGSNLLAIYLTYRRLRATPGGDQQ